MSGFKLIKRGGCFTISVSLFFIVLLQELFLPRAFADNRQLITKSGPLLHTFVEIKAYGENAGQAIDAAFNEMERINALLNNYNSDSEVSMINRQAGLNPVLISSDTMQALQLAKKFGDISRGAFDITIGPLLELWGFAQEEAGLGVTEPDIDSVRKAKFYVDYNALELNSGKSRNDSGTARLKKRGMRIDVGAFSKGYVADRAMQVLKKNGIANALISAGGTILALGKRPESTLWRIGIRHPRKPQSFLTVVLLTDKAVSTSGDYEKFYKKNGKKRTHIIDPRTGMPVEKMQSVTVIAKSAVESDALSTALFVLGVDEGIDLVNRLPGVEALIVTGEGKIFFSTGWPEKNVFY